jgi:hypothetical protein
MRRPEDDPFLADVLRSAASDGASPGAKGRALARLQLDARATGLGSRGAFAALAFLLVGALRLATVASFAGAPLADARGAEGASLAKVLSGAAPGSCSAGLEAPLAPLSTLAACAEPLGAESGSSSGGGGGSSGGESAGFSGSSSNG